MASMLKLYGMEDSGNCYKACLILAHLGRPYEWVSVNSMAGETKTEEFLRMNPNGRVPVLELAPGRYLSESNAILFHLAEGSGYLPSDPYERAQTLAWMFFEQNNHETSIATTRFWVFLAREPEKFAAQIEARRGPGYAALDTMERHLDGRDWFAADRLTIADFALYAYTHVADEGGFSLESYPRIRAWLDRVASHPAHVPMRRLSREKV